MFGNVGSGVNQSFTVVGDCVNVAFRLEALTKEKGTPVIVSNGIVESAAGDYQFNRPRPGRRQRPQRTRLDLGAEYLMDHSPPELGGNALA